MKLFIQSNFLKLANQLHKLVLLKSLMRSVLLSFSLLSGFIFQGTAFSKPLKLDQIFQLSQIKDQRSQPINLQQPLKHCVKTIELKKQFLYMTDDWYSSAEQDAKRLWQQSVIKRFGSVYGEWEVAQNKKYDCKRIGFGNDDEGNIGASVVCLIAADPCVILLNK